jgi:hypothetical protein
MSVVDHYLRDWPRDSQFYGRLELSLSIKSFDLQAIRKRYLASKKNASGRGGSVERRAVSLGGLAQVSLKGGRCEIVALQQDLKEPRGLASAAGRWAYSLENKVIILVGSERFELHDPWFSYIHTVSFNPQHEDRILVTSSGFDCIIEYDFRTGKKCWEWFAWENGLDTARHPEDGRPVKVTRLAEQARNYQKQGVEHLYIADPATDHLPTAQRTAFINTAHYHPNNEILATLFHEGSLRKIDRDSGASEVVLAGMKSPHGGQAHAGELWCTNTGGGAVWCARPESQERYHFTGLAHKAAEMGEAEWLQNTLMLDQLRITIDANRNAFVVWDPQQKLYDLLAFDANWAVQDLALGALPF